MSGAADRFAGAFGDRRGGARRGPDRYEPGVLRARVLAALAARPWWPPEKNPGDMDSRLRFVAVAKCPDGQVELLGSANNLQNAMGIFWEFEPKGFTPLLLADLDTDTAEEAVLEVLLVPNPRVAEPGEPARLLDLANAPLVGLDQLP